MSNPENIARIRARLAEAASYQDKHDDKLLRSQMARLLDALRLLTDELDPLSRPRRKPTETPDDAG